MRVIVILLATLLVSCAAAPPDASRGAGPPVEGTWVRESHEAPVVTEGMVLGADGSLGFFGMRSRSGVSWRRQGTDLVLTSVTTDQPYAAETRLIVEAVQGDRLRLGPPGHELAGDWHRDAAAAVRVAGRVSVSSAITVPPDLVLDVTLQDVSRADAPVRTIARYTVPLGDRPLPVEYALYYRASHVDPRATYVVAARAMAAGRLYYVTTRRYEVLTRDRPAEADLVMDPVGAALPRASAPAPYAEVVTQERAFAAASVEKGARTAFLAVLAEDSIVLQPGPTWGRAAFEAAPASDDRLDWRATQALRSADGNFGVATGRWLLTPRGEGGQVEGRYVTAWRRREGRWEVVFDGGYGRRLEGSLSLDDIRAEAFPGACTAGAPPARGEIEALDSSLGTGAEPWPARLLAAAHPALALYHPRDPAPVTGGERTATALTALGDVHDYRPMGTFAAGSGDIALSYGLVAPASNDGQAAAAQAYAHVWCRLDGGWRLLAELRNLLPPPK